MIKYNLTCDKNHEFESWFSDSSEFDNLKKKRLLECVFCSSKKINKSIMAPMVSGVKENNNEIKILKKKLKNEKNNLLELRKFVESNFEYVGKILVEKLEKFIMTKKVKKQSMEQLLPKKEKN